MCLIQVIRHQYNVSNVDVVIFIQLNQDLEFIYLKSNKAGQT